MFLSEDEVLNRFPFLADEIAAVRGRAANILPRIPHKERRLTHRDPLDVWTNEERLDYRLQMAQKTPPHKSTAKTVYSQRNPSKITAKVVHSQGKPPKSTAKVSTPPHKSRDKTVYSQRNPLKSRDKVCNDGGDEPLAQAEMASRTEDIC